MEYKCKIRIALVLFIIVAISAIYFVLVYGKPDEVIIDNTNQNDKKININNDPANGDTVSDTVKNSERSDWEVLIEKWKGRDISQVKTDRKVVALTFDGGANADGVEKILSILKDNDIKGTFFLTGKFIEKYPSETRAIISSGGDIGNHSYSHPHFTKLANEEIKIELERTENELSKLDATFQPFFRFPYGDRTERTVSAINEKNYISIRWTVDSLGWKGTSGGMTKESVEERVISKAVPGAIILMHLGTNPDDKTQLDSEALPEIIRALRLQDYKFFTIIEMFQIAK